MLSLSKADFGNLLGASTHSSLFQNNGQRYAYKVANNNTGIIKGSN